MKWAIKNVERGIVTYASGAIVLMVLVTGMDAFVLLYLARATGGFVVALLTVQAGRTIWGRYLRN